MIFFLESPRLKLLACDRSICEAILKGDRILKETLGIHIAPEWNSFGDDIFQFNLERTIEDPEGYTWWSYLVIEQQLNTLIGACGFKGRPNKAGEVEIGYEIAPDYRNRGYATELTKTLIQHAATIPGITYIKAYTLSVKSPSTQVLHKCGFTFIQEMFDPDDGILWQWKRKVTTINSV